METRPNYHPQGDDADGLVRDLTHIEIEVLPLLDTKHRRRLALYALMRSAYLDGRSPAFIIQRSLEVYEATMPELSGVGQEFDEPENDNFPY